MNKELEHIVKIYSTGKHEDLNSCLIGKSKDTIISMLVDLLTMYINDKNSSTIRELISVTFAGYEHKEAKIGYNGFKQDAFIAGRTLKCEAKPKNVESEEFNKYKRGERNSPPQKLNGGGNFTDYTRLRLNRDAEEKDLNMLVSGFVNGKLIYVIEFPFAFKDFLENLENQIKRWEGKMAGNKSKKGQFLRSANFDYRHFVACPNLKIVYLLSREELSKYVSYISKGFFQYLYNKSKQNHNTKIK
ncbi:conserved hypothetical protein [groundwater metagenome]|uniref:Uncharacterized protein n=1 Tax=groundwater metagenome TaxID=717931 RepID=A0A098E741_9ZZZZ